MYNFLIKQSFPVKSSHDGGEEEAPDAAAIMALIAFLPALQMPLRIAVASNEHESTEADDDDDDAAKCGKSRFNRIKR